VTASVLVYGPASAVEPLVTASSPCAAGCALCTVEVNNATVLVPNTTYTFVAVVSNALGPGPRSLPVEQRQEPVPLSVPNCTTLSHRDSAQVTVTCAVPFGTLALAAVAIQEGYAPLAAPILPVTNASSVSFTLSNPHAGQAVKVSVVAMAEGGVWSAPSWVAPMPGPAPPLKLGVILAALLALALGYTSWCSVAQRLQGKATVEAGQEVGTHWVLSVISVGLCLALPVTQGVLFHWTTWTRLSLGGAWAGLAGALVGWQLQTQLWLPALLCVLGATVHNAAMWTFLVGLPRGHLVRGHACA
jgi:hypothetical protein